MRSPIAVALAVTITAVALTACGEDRSAAQLPKAEFVRKANAVCAKYEKKAKALGTRVFAPDLNGSTDDSLERWSAFVDEFAPLSERALGELRALVPDDEALSARWTAYLRESEAGIEVFKEAGAAAKRGDRAGAQAAAARMDDHSPDAVEVLGPGACADD